MPNKSKRKKNEGRKVFCSSVFLLNKYVVFRQNETNIVYLYFEKQAQGENKLPTNLIENSSDIKSDSI